MLYVNNFEKTNMIKDTLNIINVGGAIVENDASLQSILM